MGFDRILLKLETVTPLFLGGADPRGAPELRAASVRGALRFWLRALLGGAIGDSNLDELRKAESAVFGSTDTGTSPVVVRVRVEGKLSVDNYRPLLHNPAKHFTFLGIKPAQTFSLELIPRLSHAQVSPVVLSVTALWLLLGGLGKRSRRGFGTLRLRQGPEDMPLSPNAYKDVEEFEKALRQSINKAQDEFKNHIGTNHIRALNIAQGTPETLPIFPILHSNYAKILLCKQPFPSWEEAMKAFWRELRSTPYRDNPVFGFAGSAGRQASPLHLRVVRIEENYHLLMTSFWSQFAGKSPEWKNLHDFLTNCYKKWNGTWIMG